MNLLFVLNLCVGGLDPAVGFDGPRGRAPTITLLSCAAVIGDVVTRKKCVVVVRSLERRWKILPGKNFAIISKSVYQDVRDRRV